MADFKVSRKVNSFRYKNKRFSPGDTVSVSEAEAIRFRNMPFLEESQPIVAPKEEKKPEVSKTADQPQKQPKPTETKKAPEKPKAEPKPKETAKPTSKKKEPEISSDVGVGTTVNFP